MFGEELLLTFSESLGSVPSEAQLEAALQFSVDGDNLPSSGLGGSPLSLTNTMVTDDTIRVVYESGNFPGLDPITVELESVAVVSGTGLVDAVGNQAQTGSAVPISGTVNLPPTLAAGALDPTFTEGGSAQPLFSLADASTAEPFQRLTGITVTVDDVINGADEVLVVNGQDIQLNDGNTGNATLDYAVTLSGTTATITMTGGFMSENNLESLVSSLSYRNDSDDPIGAHRTVTIVALQDSGGTLNGGVDTTTLSISSTVSLVAVNDAPTLTATPTNPLFTEGGLSSTLFSVADASTIETLQDFTGFTVTVSDLANGADEVLVVDGQDIQLVDGNSGNSPFDYDVSMTGTTATVSISGITANETDFELLVTSLTYRNESDDPLGANRTVTITSLEDSGGTLNGGSSTGSPSGVSVVSIVDINDAPTLVATPTSPVFTEGGPSSTLFSAADASATEASQSFTGFSVTVSDLANGANEVLVVGGHDIQLVDGNFGNSPFDYAVSMTGTTATVSITGLAANETDFESLITSMGYRNDSDDPLGADRTVVITSLEDSGGVLNGGSNTGSASGVSVVTLVAVNDAPTLVATPTSPVFTEGGPSSTLFSAADASTIETSQDFTGFTVAVSDLANGANEVLVVDGQDIQLVDGNSGNSPFDYAVSMTGTTATVSITGLAANEADFESLITSVTYRNDSDDPLGADRTVVITSLEDSGGDLNGGSNTGSASGVSVVSIVDVNDAPTLVASPTSPVFTEGGPSSTLFSAADASTIETSQDFTGFSVTVSDLANGADEVLVVDGQEIRLVDGNSGNSPFDYAVSMTGTTATVSITGLAANETDFESLITSVTYRNDSDDPLGADRTVVITSLEDSGGVLNGGSNSGTASGASVVALVAVNDAPTLVATPTDPEFAEGGSATLFSSADARVIETSQSFTGFTATISGLANGADEVLVVNGHEIQLVDGNSGNSPFDYAVAMAGTTATVSITGLAANETDFESLITSLTYRNDSDDPLGADRTVTITSVEDSGDALNGGSNTGSASGVSVVRLVAIDDAPTLVATPVDPAFTEGGPSSTLFSAADASTIEALQDFTGFTVTVSGLANGADEVLTVDGHDLQLVEGNSGNSPFDYAVAMTGTTATVSITGLAANETDFESLITSVTYRNDSDDPLGADRRVTITSLEDSGGGLNGGSNTGTTESVSTVTVIPVNDEPTFVVTPLDPTYTEDGPEEQLFEFETADTIESAQTFSELTITITNVANGFQEVLVVDSHDIELVDGNLGIASFDQNFDYVVTLDGSTATVSLTGFSLDVGEFEVFVNSIGYRNDSQDPSTVSRTVTIESVTDSGGVLNGGIDTTEPLVFAEVKVVSVLDATDENVTDSPDDPFTDDSGSAGNAGEQEAGFAPADLGRGSEDSRRVSVPPLEPSNTRDPESESEVAATLPDQPLTFALAQSRSEVQQSVIERSYGARKGSEQSTFSINAIGNSGILWDQLDSLQDSLSRLSIARIGTGSIGALSGASITIGYVTWIFRGGVLLSSVLASSPIWRFMDPLVIMDEVEFAEDDENDEVGVSLESIVNQEVSVGTGGEQG